MPMPFTYPYIRVSHLDSLAKGMGLKSQRADIERFIAYMGRRLPPRAEFGWAGNLKRGEVTTDGYYVDEAVSAFKNPFSKRPAGGALDRILGEGDHVIFAYLDRAFRGFRDCAVMLDAWEKRGVTVHFLVPHVDTSTPFGQAMIQIAAVFAQMDSALKSERGTAVCAYRALNGYKANDYDRRYGFKPAPNGGKQWIPDMEQRAEMVEIVHWRHAGWTWKKISDTLEKRQADAEGRKPKPDWDRKWRYERCRVAYSYAFRLGLCPNVQPVIKSLTGKRLKKLYRQQQQNGSA